MTPSQKNEKALAALKLGREYAKNAGNLSWRARDKLTHLRAMGIFDEAIAALSQPAKVEIVSREAILKAFWSEAERVVRGREMLRRETINEGLSAVFSLQLQATPVGGEAVTVPSVMELEFEALGITPHPDRKVHEAVVAIHALIQSRVGGSNAKLG